MSRFVSYLRVSTQRQGQGGLGIEAQRTAVAQYVRGADGELLEENVEVESGAVRDRPILVKSISRCRELKAILLIAKLDRLGRNVAFIAALMEAGVEFVAVDAPFASPLMLHILAAFAEHERKMISERTRAALAAAKARGVQLGLNGRKLASEHVEQAARFAEGLRPAIERILLSGAETLKDIGDGLNAEGFGTRDGSMWSPGAVQKVLKRLGLRTTAMSPRNQVRTCARN